MSSNIGNHYLYMWYDGKLSRDLKDSFTPVRESGKLPYSGIVIAEAIYISDIEKIELLDILLGVE